MSGNSRVITQQELDRISANRFFTDIISNRAAASDSTLRLAALTRGLVNSLPSETPGARDLIPYTPSLVRPEIIRALEQGADPNVIMELRDRQGVTHRVTPLQSYLTNDLTTARFGRDPETLQALIDHGANIDLDPDPTDTIPSPREMMREQLQRLRDDVAAHPENAHGRAAQIAMYERAVNSPAAGPVTDRAPTTAPGTPEAPTPPTPPPPRVDRVAATREALNSLVNVYDHVARDFHLSVGDRRSRDLREIEARLPWERAPDGGMRLTISEPMRIGDRGITIPPGTYDPDTLLDTIGDQLGVPPDARGRQAIRGTPMPGTTAPDPAAGQQASLISAKEFKEGRAKVSERFHKTDEGRDAQEQAAKDLNNLSLASCAVTPEGRAKAAAAMVGLKECGILGGNDAGYNGATVPPPVATVSTGPKVVVEVAR